MDTSYVPVVRAQLVAHRLPICAVASEVCVAIRKWLPETAVAADLLGPARQRLPETAAATEHAVAVVTVGSCCERADWRRSADDGEWAGRMITSNIGSALPVRLDWFDDERIAEQDRAGL